MTASRTNAANVQILRASPTRVGFGLGVVAGLVLWGALWLSSAGALPWGVASVWALAFGFGLLVGLAIPGWRSWRGLSIGLIVTAIVGSVANAYLQPDNPYASASFFLVFFIVLLAAWWTIGASAGFAAAVVERRLRLPLWAQIILPPSIALGVVVGAGLVNAWSISQTCAAPAAADGPAQAQPTGRLTYVSRGTICVADLADGTAHQAYSGDGRGGGVLREPTWSPDGRRLLAVQRLDPFGDDQLVVVGAQDEIQVIHQTAPGSH
jgi:hypothetical protein